LRKIEPGRKIEFQACEPWTVSVSFETRSPIDGRLGIVFATG
jgi:hypothetical protein